MGSDRTAPCQRDDTEALLYLALLGGWVLGVSVTPAVRAVRRGHPVPLPAPAAPGSAAWWAQLASSAGLLCGLAAPLVRLRGRPGPPASPARAVAGVALVAAGTALTLAGQAQLGDSWRPDVDPDVAAELVTSGPFRLARNPVLTGAAVSTAGLVVVLPSRLTAAMLGLAATAWQIQVRRVEEPHLLANHGARYRDYAAATGRFVPFLGRGLGAGSPPGHRPRASAAGPAGARTVTAEPDTFAAARVEMSPGPAR